MRVTNVVHLSGKGLFTCILAWLAWIFISLVAERGNQDGFALKSEPITLHLVLRRTTRTTFDAAFSNNSNIYDTTTTKGPDRIDPAHDLDGTSRWQSENRRGIKMTPSRRSRCSRVARRRRAEGQLVRFLCDRRIGEKMRS